MRAYQALLNGKIISMLYLAIIGDFTEADLSLAFLAIDKMQASKVDGPFAGAFAISQWVSISKKNESQMRKLWMPKPFICWPLRKSI